jgi:hypothetical protein
LSRRPLTGAIQASREDEKKIALVHAGGVKRQRFVLETLTGVQIIQAKERMSED